MATETVPVDKAAMDAIQKQLDESKTKIADLEKREAEAKKREEAQVVEIAKANEIAKLEREKRVLSEFTKRAETEFPLLPGKPEEKGALLKAMSEKLSPEEFKQAETLMTSAQAFANKSHAFTVVGRGGAPAAGGAYERAKALAKARVAEGKAATEAQAIDAILREDKDLATQVMAEECAV